MSILVSCRRILPAVTGVALFTATSLSLAAPPPAKGDRPAAGARLCAKLSCTEAQATKVAAIVAELKQDTKADRQAMKKLHADVLAEFAKAKPDEGKMKALYAKIDTHRAEIRDRVHDAAMELHGVLDESQRKLLVDKMGKRGLEGLLRGGRHHGPKGDRAGKGKGKGKG